MPSNHRPDPSSRIPHVHGVRWSRPTTASAFAAFCVIAACGSASGIAAPLLEGGPSTEGGQSIEGGQSTAPCTWYVAPTPRGGDLGGSRDAPTTLERASERAWPGEVVCLLPGTYSRSSTFYPARSGRPDAYIVYRSEGGEARLVWDGPARGDAVDTNMIHLHGGRNYIEIRGLTLDGRHRADANIKCADSHHTRVVGNRLVGGGTAGFATKFCDYSHVVGNEIHLTGYFGGWSSGVSLNSQQWTDQFAGFHSWVIGNVISGNYDSSEHHTDGNGIILDLSNETYDPSSADTPPVLVANNVVYQNGGRCIVLYIVTGGWVVNNTCYANGLDGQLGEPRELFANESKDSYWLNNLAYGWNDNGSCFVTEDSEGMAYGGNFSFNCDNDMRVDRPSAGDPVRHGDPLLLAPPPMDPARDRQWTLAIPPWQLGHRLQQETRSPLVDGGVDPRQLPGLPAELRDGLIALLETDVRGHPRFLGGAVDVGAYEVR